MSPSIMGKFLRWYDQFEDFNIVFTSFLFSIQIIHLIWLTTNVVLPQLFNLPLHISSGMSNIAIAVVDYTEIPALLSISLLYFRSFKKRANKKDLYFLILLNVQWFHMVWITDEVVLKTLGSTSLVNHWNIVLAWIAIMVDYLELPVIFEILKKALKIITKTSWLY